MTNSDWIELFHLIPPEQHNTLMLVTQSGANLGIELVIRTEPSYLVFRGRVCGNTDEGRVFFLPFSHIDYVNINRVVKEQEIRDMYEKHEAGRTEGAGESAAVEESADGTADTEAQAAAGAEPAAPVRPSNPNLTPARGPASPAAGTQRLPAAVAEATPPPAPPGNNTPTPSAARNSILERLRAQRHSPTGRPTNR